MRQPINYTYVIKSTYCSDFMLVDKSELGVDPTHEKDIYNVYAVGDTDSDNVDYLKLRTRYYFGSLDDINHFLYCYFESSVYIDPDPSPFAENLAFVIDILKVHDQFAIECLNGKQIDVNKFPQFNFNIEVKNIDYEKHALVLMQWMKGES